MGARTAGDPRHAQPTSTTSAASRRSPRAPAPRSGRRRRGRRAANGQTRGGMRVPPHEPEHIVAAATRSPSRASLRGRRRARALAGHVAFHADGSSSRATCSSPARSAASTSPAATGRRCSPRCARSLDRFPAETVVYPGPRPGDDARPGAADEPVPARAPRRAALSAKFQAPRGTHDVLPSDASWWHARPHDRGGGGAVRLAPHPDAGLRGHRALRAHVGRGLRRRAQGDVHVRPTAATAR